MPHVGARQRDDRGRHGRREQHRLPGLGGLLEQALHVGQEAEVEHLVGLVEDERLHVRDVERAAVHQVDQAPRRTDDDLDAGGQRVELALVGDAAVDGEDADAAVLAGHRQVLAHLERELTGGGDDQGLRLARRGEVLEVGVVLGDRALQHRDAEGQRLAGAGAGLTDQVGAHQGDREGHLLDGEGVARCWRARGRRKSRGVPRALGRWSGSCLFCVDAAGPVGRFTSVSYGRRRAARSVVQGGCSRGHQARGPHQSIGRLPT